MLVKKINAMQSIAIAYLITGISVINSTTDLSLVLFKQIILAVTIASFVFSISDIISIYFYIKKLKEIEELDIENKDDIYDCFKDVFLSKKSKSTKLGRIIDDITSSLDSSGLIFSIYLIFADITLSDRFLGIIVVLSFSIYIFKIGLNQSLNEIANAIFSNLDLKQVLNIAKESTSIAQNALKIIDTQEQSITDKKSRVKSHGSIQSHRKTIRRRYRTRSPHSKRLR